LSFISAFKLFFIITGNQIQYFFFLICIVQRKCTFRSRVLNVKILKNKNKLWRAKRFYEIPQVYGQNPFSWEDNTNTFHVFCSILHWIYLQTPICWAKILQVISAQWRVHANYRFISVGLRLAPLFWDK
jgi:hypothetical protein